MSSIQPDIGGTEDGGNGDGRVAGLDRDVRRARLAQAAHFDALVEIRDAQTLRLAALSDELDKTLRQDARLKALLPLQLDSGFPPRLWLDNISYVEMQPDPRTFRLVRQDTSSHVTVAESRNMRDIIGRIRTYAAHRLVETERVTGVGQGDGNGNSRAVSQLIMVWLAGFTFGVLALLAAGVLLGQIRF